ncbi:hypothetical protein C0V75_15845 [Tabrizicola sp. TH137]|uniref:hypothetical protein n=1 Tax=Tabrizicola sp. TH137 TaxID=2067452 RepID=UPI000C7E42FC|nr:hypothetical protein [Tabrizicola sp. TH137]PLL11498.1 hypothetical protein C0V75_15845 [Tabrizicola sp. TH137]
MFSRLRRAAVAHGPLFSSLSALVALVASVGGIVMSPTVREQAIHLLGGVTLAERDAALAERDKADAEFRSAMLNQMPNFTIFLAGGLSNDDCLIAAKAAADAIALPHAPRDSNPWAAQARGIEFDLVFEDRNIGRGMVTCFHQDLSALPGHRMGFIVVAYDTLPADEGLPELKAFTQNYMQAFKAQLPEGTTSLPPSPFEPDLDSAGRLVIGSRFLDHDIVLGPLRDWGAENGDLVSPGGPTVAELLTLIEQE